MFVNGKKILKLLNNFAPFEHAQAWDNVGFIIGNEDLEVDRVLVALEINDAVVDEAIEESCDLIIVHHPLIFKAMAKITANDPIGRLVLKLIKHDIKVIAAHTNLDATQGGLNDYLVELLGAETIKVVPEEDPSSILRIAELPFAMDINRFADYAKKKLEANGVRVVKAHDDEITRFAVCTGAGMDFVKLALEHNCTTLLTGDVKYHEAMDAISLGMNVIDAGHFDTENIYMERLTQKLKLMSMDQDYEVNFLVSKALKNPFEYV